jgi:NodT family efflux transporter outer membrane factor (OMF) lipoprotein
MSRSTDPRVSSLTRLAMLALAATLPACMIGPDFERPQPPAAETLVAEPLANLDAGGQTLAPGAELPAEWWTAFGSPALDATVAQALAGNRGLAAIAQTLAQAREAVNAASGGLYPKASLTAGVGREKYGAEFTGDQLPPAFTYFSVGPTVRYLLDYNGAQRRAIEQQRALAEAERQRVEAARLSLSGEVVQQALAIAATRAELATLEALLAEDRDNVKLMQAAFDAGSVSRLDVLSAQSQLASDQTLLPPLHQRLSLARHALALLVGEAPAAWSAPDFDLAALQLPASLPLSLPSELAHRRPDILAAEARLHAATAAIGVAKSHIYPRIELTATISQQATSLSNFFDQSGLAYGLASAITQPLFDGGAVMAQNRAARNAAQAALAGYQQVVLASFGQVADVLSALDHDAEQLAAQQAAVASSEETLRLTRESYRVGNVGVLQVLDAERRAQQARLGAVRAQAQRYQDSAQLFLALGGSVPAPAAEAAQR